MKRYDIIAILGYGFSKDRKLSSNTFHWMKTGVNFLIIPRLEAK